MAVLAFTDTLKNSAFHSDESGVRIARGFVSANLDTSLGANVLRRAIFTSPGFPQVGDAHPTEPNCRVVGYDIKFEQSDSVASGAIIYKTPTQSGGGTPTAQFVMRDTTSLQSIQASKIPSGLAGGSALNIKCNYANPANASDKGVTKPGAISYLRPMRTFTASMSMKTRPPASWYQAIGSVNAGSFQGFPQGYWLVAGVEADTQDGGKTISVQVSLHNKITEDWSTFVASTDSRGEVLVTDAVVTALMAKPYKSGPTQDAANGITRVYPYKCIDISSVFSIPASPTYTSPTGR